MSEKERKNDDALQALKDMNTTFEKEVSSNKERFLNIINCRTIEEVTDSQIDNLSLRYEIIERKRFVQNVYNERYNLYKNTKGQILLKSKSEKYRDYRESSDIIDSQLNIYKRILDLLKAQIEYYNDFIKTLDNAQYSIKNKIDIETKF